MQNILIENICQIFCNEHSASGELGTDLGLSDQRVT
jgi:hypothetical protein